MMPHIPLPLPGLVTLKRWDVVREARGGYAERDCFLWYMTKPRLHELYDAVVEKGPDCEDCAYIATVLNLNHAKVISKIYSYVGPETPPALLGSHIEYLNAQKKQAMFFGLFNYKMRYSLEKNMSTPLEHKIMFCDYCWGFIHFHDGFDFSKDVLDMIDILPGLMGIRTILQEMGLRP